MRKYRVLEPIKCNGRTVRSGTVELSDNDGAALVGAGLVAPVPVTAAEPEVPTIRDSPRFPFETPPAQPESEPEQPNTGTLPVESIQTSGSEPAAPAPKPRARKAASAEPAAKKPARKTKAKATP
jgi:hypothetical protein